MKIILSIIILALFTSCAMFRPTNTVFYIDATKYPAVPEKHIKFLLNDSPKCEHKTIAVMAIVDAYEDKKEKQATQTNDDDYAIDSNTGYKVPTSPRKSDEEEARLLNNRYMETRKEAARLGGDYVTIKWDTEYRNVSTPYSILHSAVHKCVK